MRVLRTTGLPCITYSLRGIIAFEITLHGPSRDLHSGIYGGTVDNPALALCQLLSQLRYKNGRINIPGFYTGVVPLSARERKELARLPMSPRYRSSRDVSARTASRSFVCPRVTTTT